MKGHFGLFTIANYRKCVATGIYVVSQIRHAFNVYDGNKYEWDHTDIYVLEKNDPAYVMQIPKSVLEYDEEQMKYEIRNELL